MDNSKMTAQLEKLFDKLNKDIFGGELPRPILTIQTTKSKSILGMWRSYDYNGLNIIIQIQYDLNLVQLCKSKKGSTRFIIHSIIRTRFLLTNIFPFLIIITKD